ncbi:hypothetical protein VTN77DRAFT_1108 [Rasamsonia byssochlamydoides]|uniref:uncharacterized protein n=1 Tax=Rasamsonia byssochlamydoides TaxID=89139 RepID=UPI003743127C
MPGLVRKLVIFAAVDGLILQPNGNRHRNGDNAQSPIQIEYRTQKITTLPATAAEHPDKKSVGLEAHGIAGLLTVASYSFLISITQREQVAQILGKPVYAVTNVAVIPLSSQADASRAILQARENLAQGEKGPGETASDDTSLSEAETDVSEDGAVATPADETHQAQGRSDIDSGIAEDVIGKKGRYGRFVTNWLSRKRWGPVGPFLPRPTSAGDGEIKGESVTVWENAHPSISISEVKAEAEATPAVAKLSSEVEAQTAATHDQAIDLMPKLLRYTKLIFSSRNFYFAYDYDLTRRFGSQDPRRSHLPLHSTVDPLYFWNRHLMKPFIENGNGAHAFVLPLIQGFVGQREFTVASSRQRSEEVRNPNGTAGDSRIVSETPQNSDSDENKNKRSFLLTLISRRSVQRPGLRYLRRGVDDDGNTANTVETEQILSTPSWDPSHKVYSFLQLRGSIPLYFSQSPYSFKPTPVLHHSTETNQLAFNRHFQNLNRRYGKIQAVSLVDKHGGEAKIGEAYETYARALNESGALGGSPLGFEWFDFHDECRGMKFENVRRLVDKLESTLDDFGDTVVQGGTVLRQQTGIVRTNCMDCLDRTGVAQCAFGQRALEQELKSEGFDIDLQGDSSTQWFNTLWADNGDAISKQYSSTAALKGDYTRTRKRDYRGALNDFGLTLSRYFNNIVNDYFSQACIDYLLGNVSIQVFAEFQVDLQSVDPGISVQKLRQNAIETSSRIVIGDQKEELIGGWTMLSPRQPNTLRTFPFEESVLLLTDAAVYNCRFDWNTDKVLSFERIDLRSISHIHYGTYITSILTDAQTDEQRNVGLVIVYQDDETNALRVNTRSLQSLFKQDVQDTPGSGNEWDLSSWLRGMKRPTSRFMAFKALPVSNSVTANHQKSIPISERDSVRAICQEIERAMMSGEGRHVENLSIIEEKEIISLAEAKKRTGYLEQLVYDVKKLVWA